MQIFPALQTSSSEGNALESERLDWVKNMRRQFSPKEMLTDDGEINQEYFKPTQVRDTISADSKI